MKSLVDIVGKTSLGKDENAKDTNVPTMMIANDINVGSKKEVKAMECPCKSGQQGIYTFRNGATGFLQIDALQVLCEGRIVYEVHLQP